MLPPPFSQGCYGDVRVFFFLIYWVLLPMLFPSPSYCFFLLSFVSDWLLYYAEDAAIVFAWEGWGGAAAVLLSLREPQGGCGWA